MSGAVRARKLRRDELPACCFREMFEHVTKIGSTSSRSGLFLLESVPESNNQARESSFSTSDSETPEQLSRYEIGVHAAFQRQSPRSESNSSVDLWVGVRARVIRFEWGRWGTTPPTYSAAYTPSSMSSLRWIPSR